MFRSADAPTKANNSFLLSLGMVNIPLSVLTGTESTRIERKEFVDGDVERPVGRQAFDKVSKDSAVVDPANIVRMAQATNGEWVILTDDEIEQATMPKGLAEVVAFVPANKITTAYVTEKVDQVRAKTSGLKTAQVAAAERAFGLFLAGLKARKVVALIKVALRGPARYAGITSDGDLLWLYSVDAIRQPKPLPLVAIKDGELSMMGQLIDSYDHGTPQIKDETVAAVQAFVDTKVKNGGTAPLKDEPNMVDVDDLFAALSASVNAKKVTA